MFNQEKMIQAMNELYGVTTATCTSATVPTYSLDCCNGAQSKKTKNKKMRDYYDECESGVNVCVSPTVAVNTADTSAQDQRSYLRDRLHSLYYEKYNELEKQFGLVDDDSPTTAKEVVERIQAGKYMLPKDEDNKNDKKKDLYSILYGHGKNVIRWRDPDLKEDKEGFEAAAKTMKAEWQKAKDTIVIASPADGLEALRAFEAYTVN